MTYAKFLKDRCSVAQSVGIESPDLSVHLFPFQADIVRWALNRGRAAIFADTGLGKTAMQLEWAMRVSRHAGKVLILCPLAVADQTVAEGKRFGVDCEYTREQTDGSIQITNYEMLDRFNPSDFAGIVLDESSILKSFNGKTRNAIIESFSETPYRLACTATPAPNDHTELGNHSEFLGVKSRVEMLAEYFVHDGGSTQNWRVKGHAEDVFWKWVCSWGAVVRLPSDLGYEDGDYALPPINMTEHVVGITHQDAWSEGYLFAPDVISLSDQRTTRRATMAARVAKATAIAESEDSPCRVWCELNDESNALAKAIGGAVQIQGSDHLDVKRDRLLGFRSGGPARILVTKPSIAGFGMNWQHCHRMIFVGASHSYEQTYQAIRRCWRFGQKAPVDVHIIRAETEGAIVMNYERKAEAHRVLMDGMLEHTREIQKTTMAAHREWNEYNPRIDMAIPEWLKGRTA